MSRLTVLSQYLAYDDENATSNPRQSSIDWAHEVKGLPVWNPGTLPYELAPLASKVVLDGTRTTSIDGTTQFSLTVSTQDPSRYRLTCTGGTQPVLRTDRGINCSSVQLTLAVKSNLSMTVTAASGTPFGSVQVGDEVLIPGLTTGDTAGPFSALNEGLWTVLTGTSSVLTLAREPGSVFSGLSEVVTPSTAGSIQAFSSTGVQVGDVVNVSAGFSATARHAYEVAAVAPNWVEFLSTAPLGQEAAAPGAAGLIFYTSAKRWIRIEATQDCVVRLNGDSGDTNLVEPIVAGDKKNVGWFEKFGAVWKLEIVNKALVKSKVIVFVAE